MVSNDLVVRFENRFLQLNPKRNQDLRAGARVTRQQARGGELRARSEGRAAAFEEIAKPRPEGREEPKQRVARQPHKPEVDHPWRRYQAVGKRAKKSSARGNDGTVESA